MKSEPDVFSIDDLKKLKRAPWDGVRNFQARNNLLKMRAGDLVLFYHSSCEPPGAAGVARVTKEAFPDHTAWNKKSDYYDPRSTPEKPVWFMVEVEFVEKLPRLVSRDDMKANPKLQGMIVVRHTRLSVQPVAPADFQEVLRMGKEPERTVAELKRR